MGVKVSIIMPAYNAEKTIEKAVASIMTQTLKDIEIIVVDDASRDSTRAILDKLAKQDSRLIIIKKEKNEGASAARNSGASIASGEFIGYVDADDWIEPDMYKELYESGIGNNSDLVVCGYKHDTMDLDYKTILISRDVGMERKLLTDKESVIKEAVSLDSKKLFAYAWNKLYRRKIIEQYHIKFAQLTLNEDYLFNMEYWNYIQRMSLIQNRSYHYVKASKDSLTQKFLKDHFQIMNNRFELMKELLQKNSCYFGQARERAANIYIKHAIAGMVKNCSSKSGYSLNEKFRMIHEMLNHPNAKEACQYAKAERKQEYICNFVYKSKNQLLNYLFARTIFIAQNKSKVVFDKLK